MSRARDIADGKFSGAVVAASADFTGTVEAADLSDGTTTVGTEYVTNGSAKAWVRFGGSGTVSILDSLNVSSITDRGVGEYTVNISNAFSNSVYATLASSTTFVADAIGTSINASSFFVNNADPRDYSAIDPTAISVATLGDLA